VTAKVPKMIAGHLVVDHTGEPWAVYKVSPWLYGVGSIPERLRVLDGIAALSAAVPYRALILGVCREATQAELADSVRTTTGARRTGRWDRYVDDAVDMISPTIRREWWIAVALHRPAGTVGSITSLFRDTVSRTARRLEGENPDGLAVEGWRQEAAHFVAQLGSIGERLTPATDVDVRWLYARAFRRGTKFEPTHGDVAEVHHLARLIDVEPVRGVAYSAVSELGDGDVTHVACVRIDDVPRKLVIPGPAQWVWELNRLDFNTDAVVWLESVPPARRRRRVAVVG